MAVVVFVMMVSVLVVGVQERIDPWVFLWLAMPLFLSAYRAKGVFQAHHILLKCLSPLHSLGLRQLRLLYNGNRNEQCETSVILWRSNLVLTMRGYGFCTWLF